MGMGSSNPSVPKAEPIPQVPQEDSPNTLEVEKQAATSAKARNGATAHLLTPGKDKGTSSPIQGQPKQLIG